MTATAGYLVLHQVTTAATRYGYVARCGCGWRAILATPNEATDSGSRHVLAAHPQRQQ